MRTKMVEVSLNCDDINMFIDLFKEIKLTTPTLFEENKKQIQEILDKIDYCLSKQVDESKRPFKTTVFTLETLQEFIEQVKETKEQEVECREYALLCPVCKNITHKKDWRMGKDPHWTDSFGSQICPVCQTQTYDDALYVRELNQITVKPENYKRERVKIQIKDLEQKTAEKKELLKRIRENEDDK
jgi:hypothetical protein